MKILYVRSSDDRKEEFQITTYIVNHNGKKYVKKKPNSSLSVKHINNIFKNYEVMLKAYNQNSLVPVYKKDDYIYSIYVEGKTLEEIFVELITKGNIDGFIKKFNEFLAIVITENNKCKFGKTKEFIQIFGDLDGEFEALKISNVDFSFDNIIVADDYKIIDCEWVFEFPIPIDFIIYRMLKNFYFKNRFLLLDNFPTLEELLKIYPFKSDKEILSTMDENFGRYVHFDSIVIKSNYIKSQIDYREVIKKNEIKRLNDYIEKLSKWGKSLELETNKLKETLMEIEGEIKSKNLILEEKQNKITSLETEIKEKQTVIKEKQTVINDNNTHIEELSKWGKSLELETNKLKETLMEIEGEIKSKNLILEEKQNKITSLETEIKEKQTEIKEKQTEIKEKQTEIKEKQTVINDNNTHIEELSKWGKELDQEVSYLRNLLTDERQKVENIKNERNRLINDIEAINNSRGYKVLKVFYRIRDFFIPRGSKRKLLFKMFFKFLRHPILFLKSIKNGQARKFFRYLKSEGPQRVIDRVNGYVSRVENVNHKISLQIIPETKDYKPLELVKENAPTVSIIIPVFNQFSYTYRAIKSIIEFTKNIKYEIIIADDKSTDETAKISEYIKNIVVSRNKKNLGFLLNCKVASKKARGKYLVFLNNDTCVQPLWLDYLLNTIKHDNKCGIVGSKLVYPDGRLQEAGGIIWNDASGWNYGRLSDPENPEYNYVKEVDYISGASILIPKRLWDKIGGFDERYVPAYFEDADLAFEVRKLGYKVIYQPLSVVVHFEGISHGTSVKEGIKSYQVKNKEKFVDKWKSELQKQFPNGVNVFNARERTKNKKTILVIDHYVPHIDKDAGSKTVYQYLKLFVSLGMNIKFIGDNFYRHEPYTTILQQVGIEVLYGPYYANNYEEWIKTNADSFDYILLNRPHISIKYIDFVKKNTKAKIIYYGHDLHFLRFQREYELTGNLSLMKDVEYWKKIEFSIIEKADLVYYPSVIEVDYLHQLKPNLNIKVLQPYLYEEIQGIKYNKDERNGIMFVGGFTHTPNIDACLWFEKEIFSEVTLKNPNITWYIVGSNSPDEINALAKKNIIVKGFVSDEELTELYSKVRLVVVPLRYGAGIKGKVVEAMKNQTPIITTSVGAEGMKNASDYLLIADEPKDFAKAILELYDNQKQLMNYSIAEKEAINKEFTFKSATLKIVCDLGLVKKRRNKIFPK